jgi:3-hydroxyisobutyrate dehydrogenase
MVKFKVGFIGLGIMGRSMAANILKAGYPLIVYNRSKDKTLPLAEAGAEVADSPAEVAAKCFIVVSCVTADADVQQVMLDEKTGVIAGAGRGLVAIDCSTVSPRTAAICAKALAAKGCSFLDAPVSGGDVGARAGTLSIMVGGKKADFNKVQRVLQAMGKTITYCGPSGAGYLTKLCNQILGGLHLVAAVEALKLCRTAGVDPQAMLAAVSSGAAGSWILSNLGPRMVAGDDKPGFFIDYQLKDLRLALDAAKVLGLDLPGTVLSKAIFEKASQMGLGRLGTQAIIKAM